MDFCRCLYHPYPGIFSLISGHQIFLSRTLARINQLLRLLQAGHFISKIFAPNLLELPEKINSRLVDIQHLDGLDRRFVFIRPNWPRGHFRFGCKDQCRKACIGNYGCLLRYFVHHSTLLSLSREKQKIDRILFKICG